MNREQLKTLAIELACAMPATLCSECGGELHPALDRNMAQRNLRSMAMREEIERSGRDPHDSPGEAFQRIARKLKAARTLAASIPLRGQLADNGLAGTSSKHELMRLLGEAEEFALVALHRNLFASDVEVAHG
jgi:hypothetical protein